MKFVKSVCLLAICLLASCAGEKGIKGEWYGVNESNPVVFTFNDDGTFSLLCEANSGMTMAGDYVYDDTTMPATIDFTGIESGMIAQGIVNTNANNEMELMLTFGVEGYTQRPTEMDPNTTDLASKYFKLSRDAKVLEEADKAPAQIPAEAQLAFERNARLGAGICLNGVVDGNSFRGTIPDLPLNDVEIKAIADAGFKSVRLCATWVKHCATERPYTIDADFFSKMDDIVKRCLDNNIAVSIDMHYYPYINMSEDDANVSWDENFVRLSMLWQQIAEHYQDMPNDMVYFDLLNEPNTRMGADKWNETFNALIKEVRKTNPGRTIIIGTPNLGQHWTLNQLELPADDWNLIVQAHYYLPHTFTHQGLDYARAEGTEGTLWLGTDADKKPIEADLDYCQKWSKRHGRPIYIGEYGVIDDAEAASRARYMGYMKDAFEKRGFSSHIWGFREAFGFYNPQTNTFDENILQALNLK